MRTILIALTHWTVLAVALSGQAVAPPSMAETVATLSIGDPIRVAAFGGRVEGWLRAVTPDSVVVGGAAADRRLAIAALDTLWSRQPAVGRGAGIGGLVGGGTAGLIGLLFAQGDVGGNATPLIVATLLGSGAGALAGAAIGAPFELWRREAP